MPRTISTEDNSTFWQERLPLRGNFHGWDFSGANCPSLELSRASCPGGVVQGIVRRQGRQDGNCPENGNIRKCFDLGALII